MNVPYKIGDRVRVIANGNDSANKIGELGTVFQVSESTETVRVLGDETQTRERVNTRFEDIELIYEGVKMQKEYKVGDKVDLSNVLVRIEDRGHSEYHIGDKFVIVNGYGERNGQVIELASNDNSSCPYFLTSWNTDSCIKWRDLAELPKGSQKPQKPTVTSTMTVYSDGVEVNETTLRFDGMSITRDELKAKVARYQEVLRRPIAVVPEVKKPAPRVRKSAAKKPVTKKVETK